MPSPGKETPLPQSVFARLAQATRYAITGVAPDTWFGPQQPLAPQAPPDVKGRQFDYPFGANLSYVPRSEGGVSFAELRGLADALPLLRAVIETRKDQIAGLSYAVRPRDRAANAAAAARATRAQGFLARPDRRHSFADWLRMLLEDVLVIDAATIYPRFDRSGALYSLDIIDGATITPLIGEDGRAPEPPDPAFQQILHGVPAADFSFDELLYLPRNLRAHRLYGMSPVEARDQSQIDLFGPRVGSIIEAHEICDALTIGPIVAQTILQRQLYVRAHFTFKLSWEYCLLDPMDIVEVTDANLGLDAYPIRIVSIEEDDKGLLSVAAEELTVGVSTPALNPNAGQYGFRINRGVAADPVNPPLIYEPPIAITGGAPQLWLAASGGSGGVADPNWGGANVFMSVDGVTYSQVATISSKLRQGTLTANLPYAPSGWDTSDTLSVSLVESDGVLTGTSQAAAQQGATLSLVDAELICYETATLTGPNAYAVTGLQRGMNGTTPASHASGAAFFRLDSAVVKVNLQQNLIGQTLSFKFQSFNVFGGGVQSLAACAVYTFTPTGEGTAHPIAAQLLTGVALDLGFTGGAASVSDDFNAVLGLIEGAIDLGSAP